MLVVFVVEDWTAYAFLFSPFLDLDMLAEMYSCPDPKWGVVEAIESRWSTSIRRKKTKIIAIAPRESRGKDVLWLPFLSFSYMFWTSCEFSTPGWRRRRIIVPTTNNKEKAKAFLCVRAETQKRPAANPYWTCPVALIQPMYCPCPWMSFWTHKFVFRSWLPDPRHSWCFCHKTISTISINQSSSKNFTSSKD